VRRLERCIPAVLPLVIGQTRLRDFNWVGAFAQTNLQPELSSIMQRMIYRIIRIGRHM